jgi:hypothetical protein
VSPLAIPRFRVPVHALALAIALAVSPAHAGARRPAALAFHPTAPQRAFVDTLERRTFFWFWDTASPATYLTPDRWPTRTFASVAAMGFGLAAYPVGVKRGWVTREAGLERTLRTLRFLWNAPQDSAAAGSIGYRGFFYHFLDLDRGTRFEKLELSSIDTGLLISGALFCGRYFDRHTAREREVGALAESLYRRVDWRWMQVRAPLMGLGWTPEEGHLAWDTRDYNETTMLLLLAMASPTHPADPATWSEYVKGYKWGTFEGEEHLGFAPLFGHQSSHIWVDYRGIRDDFMRAHGIDYFENSRRATIAQQRYAIANPAGWEAYGPLVWGLSACDGGVDGDFDVNGRRRHFQSYWARGASHTEVLDDGTITPNAAAGSIAFAPEIVVPALAHMKERWGDRVWGRYGFYDAFNPSLRIPGRERDGVDPANGWFDHDYLGIDQGLIVLMIENWRSGLVWKRMRGCPHLVRGLRLAGFRGGWLDRAPKAAR